MLKENTNSEVILLSREFNVTGTCIPEMHYMVDISGKLDSIIKLIEKGSYFTINRPRQYGKTTTMFLLEKQLRTKERFLARLSARAYQYGFWGWKLNSFLSWLRCPVKDFLGLPNWRQP